MITATKPAIKLSQSALKDLEKKDACHYYWQKKWIEGVVKEEATIAMKRGSYFETLAIGGGSGQSDDVTDLPRLKDGKKSSDQIRLEEQAERFNDYMKELGFKIIPETVQMKLETEDFQGTIDFMAIGPDGDISIWDLKSTADIYSDFGYTAWHKPETVDFTQQFAYARAWFKSTGQKLRTYMYVADYTPNKNIKVFEVKFDYEAKFNLIEQRLEAAYSYIESYLGTGDLPANPSINKCMKCPFLYRCKYKVNKPLIEEVYV